MKCDANNFGKKLRQVRVDRNLAQKELAAILDVSNLMVSFWERGHHFPTTRTLAHICNALQLSPNYFLMDS